jgi:DNA/RNA-binding domain of Phe-tRNA-synthetase-like protein
VDIQITESWRAAHPGASVGFLALAGVENPAVHPALAEHVRGVERTLRSRWAGKTRADLALVPELEPYRRYYRRFGKTYHVQLQLESVALKGKELRAEGALVLAMFSAELRSGLLTAGHDLAAIGGAIAVDSARGGEPYVGLGGKGLALQPGDMFMRDEVGILSSVLYGPDERTRVRPGTRGVVFCVYAPPGVDRDALTRHLDEILATVRLVAPGASVIGQSVFPAS